MGKNCQEFNAEVEIVNIVNHIKKYFAENGGPTTKAVIGISGGKDSTIAAALLVRALGSDRVVGVMMPNGVQKDIDDSLRVCRILGIPYYSINIGPVVKSLYRAIDDEIDYKVDIPQVTTNTPSRIRMTTLYAVAAMVGGRVINTGNASEAYVGYTTKYGDLAGDYAILADYCVSEIYQIGEKLTELPIELVRKTPSDGMCGKSDEDNLGFSYEVLDAYLLNGDYPTAEVLHNIELRHKRNLHKRVISLPHPRNQTRPYNSNSGFHSEDNVWSF